MSTHASPRELLLRGGLELPGDGAPKGAYDAGLDPAGTELVGRELAGLLAPHRPDVVLFWERVADGVLSHVIARELGARTAMAFDADGLVAHTGRLDAGDRVALLSGLALPGPQLDAMTAYVARAGATVVARARLVGDPSDTSGTVPTVIFADANRSVTARAPDAAHRPTAGGPR